MKFYSYPSLEVRSFMKFRQFLDVSFMKLHEIDDVSEFEVGSCTKFRSAVSVSLINVMKLIKLDHDAALEMKLHEGRTVSVSFIKVKFTELLNNIFPCYVWFRNICKTIP